VDLMAHFNLLRFPTLERQEKLRQQWQTAGLGALLGALLGAGCLMLQSFQTDQLAAQAHGLRSQLAERQRLAQTRQQQQVQNQLIRQQLAQLGQLQSQQQAWVLMHRGLLEVPPHLGIRLERLQVQAGQLDLQGQAASPRGVSSAAQKLSERWGIPLNLQSLEADGAVLGASALSFSWQGQWPALMNGAEPDKARP
jgi:hypothetical protein